MEETFPECEQFTGRKREICRGEAAGMPLEGAHSVNAYRQSWGLPPLTGISLSHAVQRPVAKKAVRSTTLIERVQTFTRALADHARDGLAKCDQQEIAHRLAICEKCPSFVASHCQECGCRCSSRQVFFNKLAWRSEACPLGHW